MVDHGEDRVDNLLDHGFDDSDGCNDGYWLPGERRVTMMRRCVLRFNVTQNIDEATKEFGQGSTSFGSRQKLACSVFLKGSNQSEKELAPATKGFPLSKRENNTIGIIG